MEMRRDVFQAISDPTRRAIIDLVAVQQLTVTAVANHFHSSRPAISKHLRILSECGLVHIRQEGRERYCEARLKKLREVADWTTQYNRFWDQKLAGLQAFLEREKKPRRKT